MARSTWRLYFMMILFSMGIGIISQIYTGFDKITSQQDNTTLSWVDHTVQGINVGLRGLGDKVETYTPQIMSGYAQAAINVVSGLIQLTVFLMKSLFVGGMTQINLLTDSGEVLIETYIMRFVGIFCLLMNGLLVYEIIQTNRTKTD